MRKALELAGRKFGRLTGIKVVGKYNGKSNIWLFECDCGKTTLVTSGNIKRQRSCGCLKSEVSRKQKHSLIHGMERTRFYRIWRGMKTRCLNKKAKDYPRYGGRGIKICDTWLNFVGFQKDMYESYLAHARRFGEPNTTIERVDNDGNYCKENCGWTTWQGQALNKRYRNQWSK